MSKPAARVGDMHVCPMVTPGVPPIPHVGGPIVGPGVPNVLVGGMPAAVLGDMCVCTGPPDTIALGSTGVLIGGKPAARMGDMTAHGGSIVVGMPTVLIGEVGAAGGGAGGMAGPATPVTPGAPVPPLGTPSPAKVAGSAFANAATTPGSAAFSVPAFQLAKPAESQGGAMSAAKAAGAPFCKKCHDLAKSKKKSEATKEKKAEEGPKKQPEKKKKEDKEKPVQKDTFAAVIQDANGNPVKNLKCEVKTPDGKTHELTTNGKGQLRLDSVQPPGSCEVKIAAVEHTIQQGDCLTSIAADYGFDDWKTIYNDGKNSDFKQKYDNPDIIYPGAKLHIPERDQGSHATGQTHMIKLGGPKTSKLMLTIEGIQEALPYKLTFGETTVEKKTSAKGKIEHDIPIEHREVTLEIDGDSYAIKLGHLDPVDTPSGAQARLSNLGFYTGPIDGRHSTQVATALKAFQRAHKLKEDGINNAATQSKLVEEHGS